jgi:hypothetical protein
VDEKLLRFLRLVHVARWSKPPSVWEDQIRASISDGLVTVGWGGLIKLTDAGRAAIKYGANCAR